MSAAYRRTRQRLQDALNGSGKDIDPAVRRGLIAIADEADGLHDQLRTLTEAIEAVRKTLITVGGSVVVTLVASAIGVFFTR